METVKDKAIARGLKWGTVYARYNRLGWKLDDCFQPVLNKSEVLKKAPRRTKYSDIHKVFDGNTYRRIYNRIKQGVPLRTAIYLGQNSKYSQAKDYIE